MTTYFKIYFPIIQTINRHSLTKISVQVLFQWNDLKLFANCSLGREGKERYLQSGAGERFTNEVCNCTGIITMGKFV